MTGSAAGTVARFAADWERCLRDIGREPPQVSDYVPDGTRVRLAVLAELVRIDLRRRWELDGVGKRIAEYRTEFPEVERCPQLVDLVCEEYLARRRHDGLELTEFLAEYPELAGAVRERVAESAAETVVALDEVGPGQRIDEFDLRTELGGGELGRVFLARQRSMQRLVAVRLSNGGGAPHTMAQLDHPHIVRVFDQRVVGAEVRLVYMQYLPGGTAAEVLARRRAGSTDEGGALLLRAVDSAMEAKGDIRPADSPVRAEIAGLSWPETVAWIGRRLADALDYAYRNGVVHLAIKPSNVLFTAEGIPKLADFTLHDSGYRAADSATKHDCLPYRSPEQLAVDLGPAVAPPDTRSDIYSLGALLWEMLTGTVPFAADTDDPATALEHRRGGIDPAALARIPADCPAALRRVLLTCLEPDPQRRWPDGATLAQQLELCLDPRARDLVDPPERSPWSRLRRWRIPLVALAILVPNALASVYNVQHNDKLIHHTQTLAAQHQFHIYTAVVNGLLFPIGAALLIYLGRYLLAVTHGLRHGKRYDPEVLRRTRTDAIHLGDRTVLVIFSLWLLSGLAFPIVLHGTAETVTAADYLHFVALHVVSGAIAVTYPFFLVNCYMIRCIYPMFLSHGEIRAEDVRRLQGLRRRSAVYLIVAASIPLLAVLGATLLSTGDLARIIVAVRVLCIASIAAFIAVYILFRVLKQDIDALERVLAPAAR
ncbi:serine/threonine-protein kinase [Nocardia arthritidis]|uniref:Protein kinase n=1 Tax=Nocardia arthritidis TaxID=228602 RepID=A0A6G9Y591_9NOCA|nr:serine/threonine-protein kinase [Nocardia arthritidis]QIS08359.1 protein kinase [Nocardia arthritidis]